MYNVANEKNYIKISMFSINANLKNIYISSNFEIQNNEA